MPFRTEPTLVSSGLAILAALSFAFIVWAGAKGVFNLPHEQAIIVAVIIGGVEFFIFQYLLAQKYYPPEKEKK